MLHHTALVDPTATLGADVTVGPFAVIGPHVHLGDRVEVGAHTVLDGHTFIGEGTRIFPGASLGTAPQDLKYKGEPTELHVGKNCTIREYVTLNVATATGAGRTVIGDNCLFMACSHVAHDCHVGNNVIFANAAVVAGHCHVGNNVTLGGLTGVHQFVNIGDHAFIGGCSAVAQDIPPYFLASGNRCCANGINKIGLQRRGFSEEAVRALAQSFKLLYLKKLSLKKALDTIETSFGHIPEVIVLTAFIRQSERGIIKYARG